MLYNYLILILIIIIIIIIIIGCYLTCDHEKIIHYQKPLPLLGLNLASRILLLSTKEAKESGFVTPKLSNIITIRGQGDDLKNLPQYVLYLYDLILLY